MKKSAYRAVEAGKDATGPRHCFIFGTLRGPKEAVFIDAGADTELCALVRARHRHADQQESSVETQLTQRTSTNRRTLHARIRVRTKTKTKRRTKRRTGRGLGRDLGREPKRSHNGCHDTSHKKKSQTVGYLEDPPSKTRQASTAGPHTSSQGRRVCRHAARNGSIVSSREGGNLGRQAGWKGWCGSVRRLVDPPAPMRRASVP